MKYLNDHSLINPDQSAFLRFHSTQTSLHRVVDHWFEAINNNEFIGVSFFDIKKCFDSISPDVLKYKLAKYGILNKEHKWFENYLETRMQSVVVNNEFSDYVNIKTGIPQGSNLGPLIFLLFINDFKITTPGTVCNLYADDTAVYVTGINEIDVQNKLQKATDESMKWFGDNKLVINLTKSYTMLLSSQPRDISLNIKVNNVCLEQVETFKYLGVTIYSRLTSTSHINETCKKLSQNIAALRRLSCIITDRALLIKIYMTHIQPVIDYCCTIWGQCAKFNLERILIFQKRAARIITKVYDQNVSATGLLKSIGIKTVHEQIHYFTSMLMFKCLKRQAPGYLCDQFTLQSDLHTYMTRNSVNGCLSIPKP